MQLNLNPKKDLFTLFPTRVGRVMIPNAASINPGLESAILQRQTADQGVSISNIGGWQSQTDFTEWPEAEASDLVDSFRTAVINMIRLTTHTENFDVDMYIAGWGNINRKGNFNHR